MPRTSRGDVSDSLLALRRLMASFDDAAPRTPATERSLVRLARRLDGAAVPVCMRELNCGDEGRSKWAYQLLVDLAELPTARARTVAIGQKLLRGSASDAAKLRTMALLEEIGEPADAVLADPEAAQRQSLAELASYLRTHEDRARAAQHLVETLEPEDVYWFLEDLLDAAPVVAVDLIEELLLRDDMPDWLRLEIRGLRAPLRCGPGSRASTRADTTTMLGAGPDGSRVALAWQQVDDRERALAVLVDGEEEIVQADYRDELGVGESAEGLVSALKDRGFAMEPESEVTVRRLLCRGARRAAASGRRLPAAFFLGRDMFGIYDEHLSAARRFSREHDLAALLSRGLDLVAVGELDDARELLERYASSVPSDPEGHAALGVCLLGLGELSPARDRLALASQKRPDDPHIEWNLAVALHRLGEIEECYRVLCRYRDADDIDEGAEERREYAERFVREHERVRALTDPASPA